MFVKLILAILALILWLLRVRGAGFSQEQLALSASLELLVVATVLFSSQARTLMNLLNVAEPTRILLFIVEPEIL